MQTLPHLIDKLQPYIGQSMKAIASQKNMAFKHDKGQIGQLVEQLLGVQSNSFAGPDLPELGVEIKTLPLNFKKNVLEHTHIGKISLPFKETSFHNSSLWLKMRQILFVPIIAKPKSSMSEKILAQPFLWKANCEEQKQIEQDWLELSSFLRCGQFTEIDSKIGEILHIRPKASHGKDLTFIQQEKNSYHVLPLGFYLRKSFTQHLIARNYVY